MVLRVRANALPAWPLLDRRYGTDETTSAGRLAGPLAMVALFLGLVSNLMPFMAYGALRALRPFTRTEGSAEVGWLHGDGNRGVYWTQIRRRFFFHPYSTERHMHHTCRWGPETGRAPRAQEEGSRRWAAWVGSRNAVAGQRCSARC